MFRPSAVLCFVLVLWAAAAAGGAVADTKAAVANDALRDVRDRTARTLVGVHRIVVVGDVHGDAEQLIALLKMADLVTAPLSATKKNIDDVQWAPRYASDMKRLAARGNVSLNTTLVQLGDLIDRGAEDLEVLTLMSFLKEATKTIESDNVILLMGNHELMNLMGQFHYVHPTDQSGFLTKLLRKNAFAPDGHFARFIKEEMKAITVLGSSLFVHAGLSLRDAKLGIATINDEVMQAVAKQNYRHKLLGTSGPLWTRKMIMDAMNEKCEEVIAVTQELDVERIVVGHTPQRSGKIEAYCDDRLIASDVGLSKWMYGNLAALEIMEFTYKPKSGGDTYTEVELREIVPSTARKDGEDSDDFTDPILLQELMDALTEYNTKKDEAESGADSVSAQSPASGDATDATDDTQEDL